MKKNIFYVMTIFLLLTIQPFQSKASNNEAIPISVKSNTSDSTEVSTLLIRLDVINKMDKSKLKASEKKILRNEVRSIKSQLEAKEINSGGGGVYISVGSLLLIILLLIILL